MPAARIYQPGRSRIARLIRRREQIHALRQRGAAQLADQLERYARAIDERKAAERQKPRNDNASPARDDDEPWWNR